MSHWAKSYIGLPWVRGATGPNSFDCWGFVRHIQDVRYGHNLPDLSAQASDVRSAARLIADHDERINWVQVDRPSDGDVVLLARKTIPIHIGVWVDANQSSGVLHCVERIGVMFSNLHNLRTQGWCGLTYYRHRT